MNTILYKGFHYAEKPEQLKKTVTLYHGTSSWVLPSIHSEGLQPPNFDDIVERAIGEFYDLDTTRVLTREEVPEDLINALKRKETPSIFFTSSEEAAASYAQYYFKDGGEIAFDLRRAIRNWSTKAGRRLRETLKSTKPVVIEVEIPWKLLTTPSGVHPAVKMKKILRDSREWKDMGYKSQEAYIHDHGFEWTTTSPIPPSMITNIRYP